MSQVQDLRVVERPVWQTPHVSLTGSLPARGFDAHMGRPRLRTDDPRPDTPPRRGVSITLPLEVYKEVEKLLDNRVYPTITAAMTAAAAYLTGRPDLAPPAAPPHKQADDAAAEMTPPLFDDTLPTV